MKLGTKIYYEKSTGNVIFTRGDMQGFVIETSFDEDYEMYSDLRKYQKDKIGCLKLEYGQLGQLLADNKANSYKVDVSGNPHKLVFAWIDYETGQPGEPPKSVEDLIKETENKIEKQEEKINVLSSTIEELILNQ